MSIPLDLARTLAVVIEEGTLDAAARRLHVTPSAVSQRVRALEDQLGRVVLVRSKPVRTTEAGDAVVRLARQLALLEHDALAAIGAEGGAVASVPLAVNADSLATWFLPPLARVAERRAVVFDLHRDDQDFTAGLLESGTVMAAVTSREAPVAGCRVRPLGVLRYEAVATTSFAARWFASGVDVTALSAAPVVDFDRRDDLQTQWLARRGVPAAAPPRHRVPASQDFATAVQLGLGWGLLPGFQSDAALSAGELVRLGDDPIDVPLYWQQWNLTSPLLDEVADEVVDEGRRMLAG
ncbi:transcriptional regulator, LysR family [Microbacterium testaceum StLB037]|uniref:Transcriptional regulator, LysR family n=1 Tax=Microbacterium testaceum (strain StLB037) TaxID=979556 RepID=A0A1H0Q2S4_MICTS|nr:LysR family transcriptional regulator ArgP [Microbacterium testaceum]SDP10968.1 transcriptional regulator, LysR family [Microbacterium testaceum StLB037]